MILECLKYTKQHVNTKPTPRIVKDYELDFYLKGNLEASINGTLYQITPQTILFRKPGDVTFSQGNYDCFVITFDFSGEVPKENYIRQHNGALQKTPYDDFFSSLPSFIHSKYFDLCIKLIEELLLNDNYESKSALELLFLVFADAFNTLKNIPEKRENKIDIVFEYIDQNLRKKIELSELSSLLSYTPGHFINVFKKSTGVTPFEYIKTKRLKKGETLLVTTDLSINAIADECGFFDASFFVKQFKKMYGITPNAFRKLRNIV